MCKSNPIVWVTFATAALMTALLGCKPKAVAPSKVHSQLSGSGAGHQIKADIDGVGGIIGHNDRTFIQLPGHELDIEKEQILLDGKESAKIPPGASVEIVLSNTTLSVTADGTNVLNTTIKR